MNALVAFTTSKMRAVYNISGLIVVIGIFLFVYGFFTFNLNNIVLGLIFVWMGGSIFGQFLEADRREGNASGNHTS